MTPDPASTTVAIKLDTTAAGTFSFLGLLALALGFFALGGLRFATFLSFAGLASFLSFAAAFAHEVDVHRVVVLLGGLLSHQGGKHESSRAIVVFSNERRHLVVRVELVVACHQLFAQLSGRTFDHGGDQDVLIELLAGLLAFVVQLDQRLP